MDIRVHEIETFLEFAMLCNNCIDRGSIQWTTNRDNGKGNKHLFTENKPFLSLAAYGDF